MKQEELIESLEIFSHKLKNPLHSALINLEVLRVKLGKMGIAAETIKHADISFDEIQRLEKIVERYLKYLKAGDNERAKTELKTYLG